MLRTTQLLVAIATIAAASTAASSSDDGIMEIELIHLGHTHRLRLRWMQHILCILLRTAAAHRY